MKIIITQKEKEALEKVVRSRNNGTACRKVSGKNDCDKCVLKKFDAFALCYSNIGLKKMAKKILKIAEVIK